MKFVIIRIKSNISKGNKVNGIFGSIIATSDYNSTLTINNIVNNTNITGVKYVGGIIGYSKISSSNVNTFKLYGDKLKNSKTIYGIDYVCGLIGYCYCDDTSVVVYYYFGGSAVITSGNSTNVHNVVIWDESFGGTWDKFFGEIL